MLHRISVVLCAPTRPAVRVPRLVGRRSRTFAFLWEIADGALVFLFLCVGAVAAARLRDRWWG